MRTAIQFMPWVPRFAIDESGAFLGAYPSPDAPCPPCPICGGTDTSYQEYHEGDVWRCNEDDCPSNDMDMPEFSDGYFDQGQVEGLVNDG